MLNLLAILGGFFFVFVIIAITLYVLKSLGLYQLAVNSGIENAWLSWIPVGDMYIIAKLIKSLKIGDLEIPRIELALPIGYVLLLVFSNVHVLSTLITIAFAILFLFALYKLYSIYRPDQAVLWLVLSIIFFFMPAVFLFIMRNDRPASQPQ